MAYFKDYPKVITKSLLDNSNNVELTDIFRRCLINIDPTSKSTYDVYHNASDLRPEQISHILYGDAQYYWTILLANNIVNIENDWSMNTYDLDEYISEKYKLNSQYNIKHYVTQEIKNTQNKVILKAGLVVPANFTFKYNNITYNNITPITYREFEVNKNEQKKLIKVLKGTLVSLIDNQFYDTIKYKSGNLDLYNRKIWEN